MKHAAALSAVSVSMCVMATGAFAGSQPPRALIFTEAGNPLGLVPGRTDGRRFTSFTLSGMSISPDGDRWTMTAASSDGPSLSFVLSGTAASGISTVATQNEVLPGLGFAFDRTPADHLKINNRGDVAFSMVALGGTASNREMMVRYNGASNDYSLIARADNVIPGLDLSVPGATGERYGSTINAGTIFDDGRIAFIARSTRSGLPSDRDDFMLISGDPVTVLAQTGVFVPSDQRNGATDALVGLDTRAQMSANGQSYLLTGSLNRTTNPSVVVVNGRAVLEDGATFPGLNGAVTLPSAQMFPGGDWVARGTSTGGVRYLIVNGELRVVSGTSIPNLAIDGLISTISSPAMNLRGDLAYAISTTTGSNYIIVDPVGLDPYIAVSDATLLNVGGSPRGDLFYGGTLTGLPMELGNDGELYFFTRARDQSGLNVADGLFTLNVLIPAPASSLAVLSLLGVMARRRR